MPQVLFLNRGKLRGQGTMAELLAQGFFRGGAGGRPMQSPRAGEAAALLPGMSPFVGGGAGGECVDGGGGGFVDEDGDDKEAEQRDEAAEVCAWVVDGLGVGVERDAKPIGGTEKPQHFISPPSHHQDAYLSTLLIEGHTAAVVAAGDAAGGAPAMQRSLTVGERKAAAEKASIIAKEQRQAGAVGLGPYAAYTEGMGGVGVALAVLLLMAAAQVAAIFTNLQLSEWVKLPFAQQQRDTHVIRYLVLGA